jgi:hypothetical protein
MPTREKLESLKKDFQINLEKLEKEIADLASLEKDITVLNEKVRETNFHVDIHRKLSLLLYSDRYPDQVNRTAASTQAPIGCRNR